MKNNLISKITIVAVMIFSVVIVTAMLQNMFYSLIQANIIK